MVRRRFTNKRGLRKCNTLKPSELSYSSDTGDNYVSCKLALNSSCVYRMKWWKELVQQEQNGRIIFERIVLLKAQFLCVSINSWSESVQWVHSLSRIGHWSNCTFEFHELQQQDSLHRQSKCKMGLPTKNSRVTVCMFLGCQNRKKKKKGKKSKRWNDVLASIVK